MTATVAAPTILLGLLRPIPADQTAILIPEQNIRVGRGAAGDAAIDRGSRAKVVEILITARVRIVGDSASLIVQAVFSSWL